MCVCCPDISDPVSVYVCVLVCVMCDVCVCVCVCVCAVSIFRPLPQYHDWNLNKALMLEISVRYFFILMSFTFGRLKFDIY